MGIRGTIDGIKKAARLQMEALEEKSYPRHCLVSPELAHELAALTHTTGKEIAVYLDRRGRVRGIMTGDRDTVPLLKDQLRRSENRLSQIRCIHTHPSGDSTLSEADLAVLSELKLDAIVAIGCLEGNITDIRAAFPSGDTGSNTGNEVRFHLYGPFTSEGLEDFPFLEILASLDKVIIKPPAHDTGAGQQKTLLLGFKQPKGSLLKSDDSLSELEELAKTANAAVAGRLVVPVERPDPAQYIGKGKVKELVLYCQQESIDLVIFDEELSPRQQKNLQAVMGCDVIDRTALILQIFADRARTKEGKLQVELAQLNYLLPRLIGYGTSLSRLGGGIGTRGPGETKLETDRRRIRKRISDLQKEIELIKKQRSVMRQQRQENHVPVVAIVGYTNAGKSTLMNALTEADVLVENKLFATLDPTTRRLILCQGEVLLTDTVGFIHKLPHQLVAAFRATLEEINHADLLLHVIDAGNPAFEAHIQSVENVLLQIGAGQKPSIAVFNKWDLVEDTVEMQHLIHRYKPSITISALKKQNIDGLLELIGANLPVRPQQVRLLIPFAEASLLNELYKNALIAESEYVEEGILCTANLAGLWLDKLKPYFYEKES